MEKFAHAVTILILTAIALCASAFSQTARWSEQKANDWYAQQPWLVGSNYIPKSAINELEMWQETTFDPAEIDKELGWAEAMGMNTMRVFLHDLLWQQDAPGFRKPHRPVSDDRVASSHPSAVRALRFLLGSRAASSARSTLPFPACTTPAGCRVPARRRWPIPASIRA